VPGKEDPGEVRKGPLVGERAQNVVHEIERSVRRVRGESAAGAPVLTALGPQHFILRDLVIPRGIDKTDVVFDFYFQDVASPRSRASIEVSGQIQDEDVAVCASVQRGLRSRAYTAGRLSVRVDEREVNALEPGDHFGEIAAIDWGRDFSYGRTATVVPVEHVELLAFPAAALRELMAESPGVDRAIRRIAQARLGTR
jgi:hypothetical protein